MDLQQIYVYPSSPEDILRYSHKGLQKRWLSLLNRYQKTFEDLDLWEDFESSGILDSPQALFLLIHSSLELALLYLHRQFRSKTPNTSLVEHTTQLISKALVQSQNHELEPHHRLYRALGKMTGREVFPTTAHYYLLPNQEHDSMSQRLGAAKKILNDLNPELVREVDLFIRDYAFFDPKADYTVNTVSFIHSPGHIMMTPEKLMQDDPCELNTELEAIAIAAHLIHESRHQKGYFFNRAIDPDLRLAPSGFVHRQYRAVRTNLLLDFELQNMLDLCMAVSTECIFWQFMQTSGKYPQYSEQFEKKIQRKKKYWRDFMTVAEMHQHVLTPQGAEIYQEILRFWENPTLCPSLKR